MRIAIALTLVAASCSPPAPARVPMPAAVTAPGPQTEVETIDPPALGFYAKRIHEGNIPILGHASVTDEGLFATRERLRTILAHAPRLRENLEEARLEIHVIGLKQFASDLPEHRAHRGEKLDNGEIFDWHMIGGHITGRFSSCTEATVIGVVGHRLFGEDPCIHELAHAVDLLGLGDDARARIAAAYERSIAAGHWKGVYASKNAREWFAEVTRFYFATDTDKLAFYNRHVGKGREFLRGEDPEAYALVDELYSGRMDPGSVRRVRVALGPASAESALRSRRSNVPASVVVENLSSAPIHLVWVDFDGHRDPRQPFAASLRGLPGDVLRATSFAGHTFVITDDEGRGLCTFAVGETRSVVTYERPCR